MPEKIPMSSPDLTGAEVAAVEEVLSTRHLSLGPRLKAFERAFAAHLGARYAIGVNSGTSGLHLCAIAAGLGEGDLAITTPFSFIASANCILYERAIPVFVDVDPATGNLDPALVAEAARDLVTGGSAARRWLPPALRERQEGAGGKGGVQGSLKAILPVHAFGQPADVESILQVARAHGLAVIEDACEAIGAEYRTANDTGDGGSGRRVGTLGDAAVFAFYPNKQMTTGEGGMIVTDRAEWADLLRSLRNQGRDLFDAWLSHARLGYNYRLDEMSAALGLAQLRRIEELLSRRERVARWYGERLQDVEGVERPHVAPTTSRMSWFVYVVRIRPPVSRDKVMRRLSKVGIPSRPYFTPIHLQPLYRERYGYRRGDYPVTERLGDTSLALPFSGVMTEEQVDRVCTALKGVLDP